MKQDLFSLLFGFFVAAVLVVFFITAIVPLAPFVMKSVSISSIDVGGLSKQEAIQKLQKLAPVPQEGNIIFTLDLSSFPEWPIEQVTTSSLSAVLSRNEAAQILSITVPISSFSATYNYDEIAQQAWRVGRNGSTLQRLKETLFPNPRTHNLTLKLQFDQDKVKKIVTEIATLANVPPKAPSVILHYTNAPRSLEIYEGKKGLVVNEAELQQQLFAFSSLPQQIIEIPTQIIPNLSPDGKIATTQRAQKVIGRSLSFNVEGKDFSLSDIDIISFFSLPEGFYQDKIANIVEEWKDLIDRPVQEPVLVIEENIVKEFNPPKNGWELDKQKAIDTILTQLYRLEQTGIAQEQPTQLPISESSPSHPLSEQNSLGISERIGLGESTFFHSIPSRVHNVQLTLSRVNNALIAPGEVFSFNTALGDVSAKTGYQPAYIIQQGRTVLGDGGGVCQGSTTVFRAALNAGLPIIKRKGHSYRVGYYEQNSPVGIDATVFSPSTDFQFKNDTSAYILLHTEVDTTNYYARVELWGTGDGRIAEISDFKLWDKTPALPTQYIDDPSLPLGKLKQIDWSAPGAKASFRYVVKRKNTDGNEEVLQDRVFFTLYQPWAAVYLRGTQ